MVDKTSFTREEQTQRWLDQFGSGDRLLAEELLSSFMLVSRDDFNDQLRARMLERAADVDGIVGLYAERELRHRFGIPNRLFKEPIRKPRRAEGSAGPPAVKATKAYDPSVGSEGIVARIITDLCREFPRKFVSHPGPEKIRRKNVRAFWVVTDLIGSGQRAYSYLQAAWLVRSVRSWWSGKFMRFAVVAYASTEQGERHVKSHNSRPDVFHVMPCPTISTAFSPFKAGQMRRLCETYDPTSIDSADLPPWGRLGGSLGYNGTGALLVFAHGAPNNVPLIFHKASKRKNSAWVPLFPSRVSAGIDSRSFGVSLTTEKIQSRLRNIGQDSLARSAAVVNSQVETGKVFLLLGALSRPPRLDDRVLSRRTGMQIYEVAKLCRVMTSYGWIDSQRRLTDAGQGQLRHARNTVHDLWRKLSREVHQVEQMPYYPKSLRHPV